MISRLQPPCKALAVLDEACRAASVGGSGKRVAPAASLELSKCQSPSDGPGLTASDASLHDKECD